MKIKNHIVNYFVAPPSSFPEKGQTGFPRVFKAPATMKSEVARDLIAKELKVKFSSPLLHVCFDVDSGRIYMPNASEFLPEVKNALLGAAKVRITKDYGEYSQEPPIEGSPFSSLRVRKVSSFALAQENIQTSYGKEHFKDLPVLEVNFARMPTVAKALQQKFPDYFRGEGDFLGGYIDPSKASRITFWDEIDNNGKPRKQPIKLVTQSTPFILINDSPKAEVTSIEKDSIVLSAYRDYLSSVETGEKQPAIADKISQSIDLFEIHKHLYLGWSFEEVCSLMLRQVTDFPKLLNGIHRLCYAARELAAKGYKSPIENNYYITFKVDNKDFPIRLENIVDVSTGGVNFKVRDPDFSFIDYDLDTGYILIETPAFMDQDICQRVLKAKSRPFISQYNPRVRKIDVKCSASTYDEMKRERVQLGKITALIKDDVTSKGSSSDQKDFEFRTGPQASGEWAINPNVFFVRKITDYPYAFKHISDMCKQTGFNFQDLDVVLGPIEQLFGRGTMGGYMPPDSFKDVKVNGKPIQFPYEMVPNVFVTPPLMAINSLDKPSYAEQTDTLIHEYRHHIFDFQNPTYKKQYGDLNKAKGKEERVKEWQKYLSDPNERAAHKVQIRYKLSLGESVDEIIRDKVGGEITLESYPEALIFRSLVNEVISEMEQEGENNEKSIG